MIPGLSIVKKPRQKFVRRDFWQSARPDLEFNERELGEVIETVLTRIIDWSKVQPIL